MRLDYESSLGLHLGDTMISTLGSVKSINFDSWQTSAESYIM